MFGDRKGPNGDGERTGRGLGYCSGSDTPGCMKDRNNSQNINCGYGIGLERGVRASRGLGSRASRGTGLRRVKADTRNWHLNSSDSMDSLKRTKESLEKKLEEVNLELKSFEK
jgi:hypothetical protein